MTIRINRIIDRIVTKADHKISTKVTLLEIGRVITRAVTINPVKGKVESSIKIFIEMDRRDLNTKKNQVNHPNCT